MQKLNESSTKVSLTNLHTKYSRHSLYVTSLRITYGSESIINQHAATKALTSCGLIATILTQQQFITIGTEYDNDHSPRLCIPIFVNFLRVGKHYNIID